MTRHIALPLNALRAFEATARHMSFSKAAVELNVTPAALSHQVKALENLLGRRLFERKSRTIELTATGRELFPGLREGFDTLRLAVERVSGEASRNVLVVSATPGLTAKWIVPRLYRFLQANPDLEVRVAASLSFSNLSTDGVDVGIRLSDGNHPGLHVEKLMDERVLPLCSPALLSGAPRLRHPRDLARCNLIHIELPLSNRAVIPSWSDWFREAGVDDVSPASGLRFNVTEHALDAAAEGAGVVLAYKEMASEDIRSGRLVSPFGPEVPLKDRSYYFVCAAGRESVGKIRRFRAWISREIDMQSNAGPSRTERRSRQR